MKERPFELFVFDWDGTCMDTTHAIACAIQEAARVLGLGHKDMMSRAVPDCTDAIYPAYKAEYWKAYIKEEDRITGLHPGMREMLTAMKDAGLWSAIATGKSRAGLARVLAKTGSDGYFCASRTMDEAQSKPSPDMLRQLSDECCIPISKIGRSGDAVKAIALPISGYACCCGVTWGAGWREALEKLHPIAVVDTVPELARAIGVEDLLK